MPRTEFGFERTISASPADILNCQHIPGMLIAADLERMAREDGADDVVAWAKQKLLASPGALVMAAGTGQQFRIPTLVPARQANGHCVWLQGDRCTIHAVSPYGCAFIDAQMTHDQANQRSQTALMDILRSWQKRDDGYADLWEMLWLMGRRSPGPEENRRRMKAAMQQAT